MVKHDIFLQTILASLPSIFIGFAIIGTVIGLYCGVCAIAYRNPMNFSENLGRNINTDKEARDRKSLRAILGIAAIISLFPIGNICVGIILPSWVVYLDNPKAFNEAFNEGKLFPAILVFVLFAWIIGAIAVQTGIVPLETGE